MDNFNYPIGKRAIQQNCHCLEVPHTVLAKNAQDTQIQKSLSENVFPRMQQLRFWQLFAAMFVDSREKFGLPTSR